jgi:hypothetical protein
VKIGSTKLTSFFYKVKKLSDLLSTCQLPTLCGARLQKELKGNENVGLKS